MLVPRIVGYGINGAVDGGRCEWQRNARRRADGDTLQLGIGLSSYVEITGPSGEAGGQAVTPQTTFRTG